MTPEELDAFLAVAAKHGVSLLRVGDVVLGPRAAAHAPVVSVEPVVPRLERPAPKTPEEKWERVEEDLWPGGLPT